MHVKRFAIAQCNFTPTKEQETQAIEHCMPCSFLPLCIGDRIVVQSDRDGWCYGYFLSRPSDRGLFPTECVTYVTKMSITGCSAEGASLVEEINGVVHQWWARIRELYAKHTELHWQEEVLTAIDDMLRTRKKILSGGVPAEELNALRTATSARIDRGNMLLSLNVTIRKEGGSPYSEQDGISLLDTYYAHREAQKRVASDPKDSEADVSSDVFSLMLTVDSVKLSSKYNCEFMCAIYDVEAKGFLTEPFRFLWTAKTKSFEDSTVKCLFMDLRKEDIRREDLLTRKDEPRRLLLITRVARIAPIDTTSSTLKKQQEPGHPSLYCRQLLAFDLMDLNSVLTNGQSSHMPKEHMIVLNTMDNFHEALNRIVILNKIWKNPNIIRADEECKIMVSMQLLGGSFDSVKTKNPHLFARAPPALVRRTELINWISSDEPRNELFVTLSHGEICGKSSDKNIECRLAVVRSNGETVQSCFECVEPSGIAQRTVHHSYVLLHEDKPKWYEQVKIRLPDNIEDDLHLKFSFYNRRPYDKNKPEKGPMCIAYAKIMHQATLITDGEHELLVYKVESSHYDDTNNAYLELPESRQVLKDSNAGKAPQHSVFSLSEKSSFVIETRSCSSILTHDPHLLTVFRWRMNKMNLNDALAELIKPTRSRELESELIKNLPTFLDTIFAIWEAQESTELPIFDSLVSVLRLTEEPQHSKAAPILQDYIDKFPFTSAATKLIRCVNHYLSSVDTTRNDKTRSTLKVLGKLTQLIVNSKLSADSLEVEIPKFEQMIDALLDSFVVLMAEKGERMTVQNTALKHLPNMIAALLEGEHEVYPPLRLTKHVIRIISSFGQNIVPRERLGFVGQLIDGKLFDREHSDCRADLFPKCVEQLLIHLDSDPDIAENSREFVDRALECGRIVGGLVEKLWPANSASIGTDDELARLIVYCYRPIVRTMVQLMRTPGEVEEARALLFSLVLTLLGKMSAQTFGNYLESREQEMDRMDFLMEMVQMLRDLLTKSPFPSTWTQMILLQNRIVHKTLKFVQSAIQQFFSNDCFYSDLWQEYMLTLVCYVTQHNLQPEVEWLGDDSDVRFTLRKAAAQSLRSMWFRLTPAQKMSYIPHLVGAFLKVALIDDDEIREAIIPIFFDMMQCEFHSSVHERSKNFKKFSDELVVQLDCLVDQDRGTRAFQRQFTSSMSSQCMSDSELWTDGGKDFISRIDRLLGHLFEYRNVRETSDCMENGMSRTVELLRYYEQYHHDDLHISYVYKLYDLHILNGNEIEAALTLLMHVDKMRWTREQLPDFLVQHSLNRNCARYDQLYDHLLNEIVDLFAKGDMWERAIEVLNKLLTIPQSAHDYGQIANLMTRQAELYRKVDKENRAFFYYYHVAFYGKGFPTYLNGKRFVFRSDKLERHPDFIQRMKQIYGSPESLTTMDDCSSLGNSPGKFMQVFNVDPVEHDYWDNGPDRAFYKTVHPAFKECRRHYNIQKFEYSRIVDEKSSKWTEVENTDLMRQWISKRIVATKEPLPTILRFSQVVSVSAPIMISPLERALQSVTTKNRTLMEAACWVLKNPLHSVRNFSGDVLGVVRPAVQGGVKNYEIFFENGCAQIYTDEEKVIVLKLSSRIIEQLRVVEYCIYTHGTRLSRAEAEADKKMHELLIDGFSEHRQYVEHKFGKMSSSPCLLPEGTSIYDYQTKVIPPLSEDKKKSTYLSSSSMSMDENSKTNTLKGLKWNPFTGPRKSVDAVSNLLVTPTNTNGSNSPVRLSNDLASETARMFERVRLGSVDNIKKIVQNSPIGTFQRRHPSNASIEGVRLRDQKRRPLPEGPAPPLPARIVPEENGTPKPPERVIRNRLLPDKKDSPQPPTPNS